MIVIVMGVTGSGKSSVGSELATQLGWPFVDGDDLHPEVNVVKMTAGHALTDIDRAPWLTAIGARMDMWLAAGKSGVVACSALRREYRDTLRHGRERVQYVFLDVEHDVLAARLAGRQGHFMPTILLDSQLSTLEPPTSDEHAITIVVDNSKSPEQLAQEIIAKIDASWPR